MSNASTPSASRPEIETDAAFLLRLLEQRASAGISRLANLTKLDCLDIHVWQAVRPTSRSLTVSQGKGLSEVQAKISALVESLELFCAEQPPTDLTDSALVIGNSLGYDPADLPMLPGRKFSPSQARRWTAGTNLISGKATFIPTLHITLDFHNRSLGNYSLVHTSNGLGGGKTTAEARLHGVYEAIERDALYRHSLSTTGASPLNPKGGMCDRCSDLLDRWALRGFVVEAFLVPAVVDLPCVVARIISPDGMPITFGSACRLSAQAAFTAALVEAAQSRLTLISGARDDISLRDYLAPGENLKIRPNQFRHVALEAPPVIHLSTPSVELDVVLSMLRKASLAPISVALHEGLLDIPIFFVCIPELGLPV